MKNKILLTAAVIFIGMSGFTAASAQTKGQPSADLMPPVSAQSAAVPTETLDSETHPTLKLTPDKSELVRLDRDASSVVIGNPAHVTVLLDTPRLAVVIPRAPGATYFTVLDKDGNVIMQRHAVVASPKKNYVRVRRSCANATGDAACQPTSVYFCPDMCHEIGPAGGDGANAAPAGTSE